MPATLAEAVVSGSGSPSVYVDGTIVTPQNWAFPSTLVSTLLGSFQAPIALGSTEKVVLDRTQQRIMGRALRRSLRIIA